MDSIIDMRKKLSIGEWSSKGLNMFGAEKLQVQDLTVQVLFLTQQNKV